MDNFQEPTEDQLIIQFKERHKERTKEVFKQMVDYLRHIEKEYYKDSSYPFNNNTSGIQTAKNMVTDGYMTMQMFLNILPAIENYNKPYEITEI